MFDNLSDYWYAVLIAVLLAAIALGFLVRFVLPALRLGGEFAAALGALETLRRNPGGDLRQRVADEAMAQPAFARVWAEYAQTLHAQPGADGAVRWRATALAETFFTDQSLVDTPLKTEYYKHLPGILTGLGIIGTFTGLIIGLTQFDVSLEPGQAQAQLRALINAVGHAFVVSALAIALAMLFTWIEKSLVAARYRQIEQLRQLVDGLFDVGVDVEYLERLVRATEAARDEAREARTLLTAELRVVLGEIAARQIDAAERHHERLAQGLGSVLAERLGQPIADIAQAVNSVTARQDEAVTRMIGEVLGNFSTQMQNLFAAQVRETHELLVATNGALRQTAGEFAGMAGRLDATGRDAVDAMSTQLRQSAVEAEARQQALQGQMSAQLEQMAQTTDRTFAGFSTQVERLATLTVSMQQSLNATLAGLSRATQEAIDGMGASANTLATAAQDFARAGSGVSDTMAAATTAAARMNETAELLATAAAGARELLDEQGRANAVFAAMVRDLRETVATARRDASLSATLVDRLQAAAERLGAAQTRADEDLGQTVETIAAKES